MKSKLLYRLASLATVLALLVVCFGAYTRLSHSGLGCPDWPGCFGRLSAPQSVSQISLAQLEFPESQVEPQKAQIEMLHRYLAASLGALLFAIAILSYLNRKQYLPFRLPIALVVLTLFQAILGWWTVSYKLWPVVVVAHLLGGMTLLALISLLRLRLGKANRQSIPYGARRFRGWSLLLLAVIMIQIALGGWVSANYAGLACEGFPLCSGHWPAIDWLRIFSFHGAGNINYQGGVLPLADRAAIQFVHRLGALLTLVLGLGLASRVYLTAKSAHLRQLSVLLVVMLGLQVTLGVLLVVKLLPIDIAVAHNAGAALLLLTVVAFTYRFFTDPRA